MANVTVRIKMNETFEMIADGENKEEVLDWLGQSDEFKDKVFDCCIELATIDPDAKYDESEGEPDDSDKPDDEADVWCLIISAAAGYLGMGK